VVILGSTTLIVYDERIWYLQSIWPPSSQGRGKCFIARCSGGRTLRMIRDKGGPLTSFGRKYLQITRPDFISGSCEIRQEKVRGAVAIYFCFWPIDIHEKRIFFCHFLVAGKRLLCLVPSLFPKTNGANRFFRKPFLRPLPS